MAVASAISQTYENSEIIIVDDCSSDNTEQFIRCLEDKRIRYIRHETNSGSSAARNTGILNAKGAYVCFLDDDDEYLPGKIEELLKPFAADPEVGFVYSQVRIAGEYEGAIIPRSGPSGEISLVALAGPIAQTNATLIRKSVVVDFDEDMPTGEDWDFHARILMKTKGRFVGKVTAIVNWDRDRFRLTTNRNKFKCGMNMLEKKHIKTLSNNEFLYAKFLKGIGVMFIMDLHDSSVARKYFVRSMRIKYDPITIINFVVSCFGPKIYGYLFKLKQKHFSR